MISAPVREAKLTERGPKSTTHRVVFDAAGQLSVQLDQVGGELEDVGKTCKARTGVVDGQAHAHQAQLLEGVRQPRIVVDPDLLGQLHDHARLESQAATSWRTSSEPIASGPAFTHRATPRGS